jgi:hypothetical protein
MVPVSGGHAADFMSRKTKDGRATGLLYEYCFGFSSILEHMRRSYKNFTVYCIHVILTYQSEPQYTAVM